MTWKSINATDVGFVTAFYGGITFEIPMFCYAEIATMNRKPKCLSNHQTRKEPNMKTEKPQRHTPGPWTYEHTTGIVYPTDDQSGAFDVCRVHRPNNCIDGTARMQANGALIASAPDFYYRLKLTADLIAQLNSEGAFNRLEGGSDAERFAYAALLNIVEKHRQYLAACEVH